MNRCPGNIIKQNKTKQEHNKQKKESLKGKHKRHIWHRDAHVLTYVYFYTVVGGTLTGRKISPFCFKSSRGTLSPKKSKDGLKGLWHQLKIWWYWVLMRLRTSVLLIFIFQFTLKFSSLLSSLWKTIYKLSNKLGKKCTVRNFVLVSVPKKNLIDRKGHRQQFYQNMRYNN